MEAEARATAGLERRRKQRNPDEREREWDEENAIAASIIGGGEGFGLVWTCTGLL